MLVSMVPYSVPFIYDRLHDVRIPFGILPDKEKSCLRAKFFSSLKVQSLMDGVGPSSNVRYNFFWSSGTLQTCRG
jgi:hypothetical protein